VVLLGRGHICGHPLEAPLHMKKEAEVKVGKHRREKYENEAH